MAPNIISIHVYTRHGPRSSPCDLRSTQALHKGGVHFRNSSLYLGFGLNFLPSPHVDDMTTSAYILLSVLTEFIVIELQCNDLEYLPVSLNGILEVGKGGRHL